jgi:hypothetical protein
MKLPRQSLTEFIFDSFVEELGVEFKVKPHLGELFSEKPQQSRSPFLRQIESSVEKPQLFHAPGAKK